MNTEPWVDFYQDAVLEVDGEKMPDRIISARFAIEARLRQLAGDSDHSGERQRIQDALQALNMLEAETRDWKRRA